MGVERLKEIAAQLRDMVEFAENNSISREISVQEDYYNVDLGSFGEQSMEVEIDDYNVELDADGVLDEFPITSNEFTRIADELDAFELPEAEAKEADLETVLAKMEANGGAPLVKALRAVMEAFNMTATSESVSIDFDGMSVGPLPSKPLPWPGALRAEIDYTAADFPLRYNPPPGFVWVTPKAYTLAVDPREAEQFDAQFLFDKIDTSDRGQMMLDNKGRVSWIERGDDDLSSGKRWAVWFIDRDGIPRSSGDFTVETQPLALDAEGCVLGEWIGSTGKRIPWQTPEIAERAYKRVAEIRAAYEVSLLGSPMSYDPKTVALKDLLDAPTRTRELRLGDNISGYGRVLGVKDLNGTYQIRLARERTDEEYEITDERTQWYIEPIALSDRDSITPAISLPYPEGEVETGRPEATVDYDPLTVEVTDESTYVRIPSSQLRLGDDIIGPAFGRVTGIEDDASMIVMVRDGAENRTMYTPDFVWSVRPITLPNRSELPTAIELAQQPVF